MMPNKNALPAACVQAGPTGYDVLRLPGVRACVRVPKPIQSGEQPASNKTGATGAHEALVTQPQPQPYSIVPVFPNQRDPSARREPALHSSTCFALACPDRLCSAYYLTLSQTMISSRVRLITRTVTSQAAHRLMRKRSLPHWMDRQAGRLHHGGNHGRLCKGNDLQNPHRTASTKCQSVSLLREGIGTASTKYSRTSRPVDRQIIILDWTAEKRTPPPNCVWASFQRPRSACSC